MVMTTKSYKRDLIDIVAWGMIGISVIALFLVVKNLLNWIFIAHPDYKSLTETVSEKVIAQFEAFRADRIRYNLSILPLVSAALIAGVGLHMRRRWGLLLFQLVSVVLTVIVSIALFWHLVEWKSGGGASDMVWIITGFYTILIGVLIWLNIQFFQKQLSNKFLE